MKKIVLSIVTIATALMASGDVEAAKVLNNNTPIAEKESGFLDRFHAKGDLRLRHEIIERDDKDDKYRERYRFRYNLNVDITDNFLLETAISSGKGNPTSGNVSFKDDENIKDYFIDELKIDIVDIAYKFDNSWIRAGKSKHHIYRPIGTQLVWDNDIRLEGVNYGYKNDSSMIRVGVNRVHREAGYKDGDDINIFLAQYVHILKIGDTNLNLGTGYYYYDGVKGNTVQSKNKFKQNSQETVNGVDVYAEDYGILEAFAEVKQKDLIMGIPFKAAVILAYNTLASEDNFGYDVSMQLGATKKVGDFKAAATYRDIEKDAVYGAHNDSDFSGGGTDSKGYYIKGKYKFAKNVDLGAWFNWSKLGDDETDYHRVQLDAVLKF